MDGITIDTEPLYTRAEINLFKEYGIKIPEEDWSLFRGSSEKLFYKHSMQRYEIAEKTDVFIKKGRKYVRAEFDKGVPFMSGFKKLHKRISPYYLTGLVTASPRKSLNRIINELLLDDYFNIILSGEETKKNKPHPHPYKEAMRQLNVLPQNTIIIEDSLVGIQSAIRSGAHVIAKTGSVPQNKLIHAHRVVNHLDQITLDMIQDVLFETL